MVREYLLSICMMVKNEERNIKKCLDALNPLLEKDDVELVIVDTGSEDNTAAIAGQYTDKLYFHRWENHFSKMRNITISYAKGEFIFILDADEVLTNPMELYEAVNKEKHSANTFTVRIKNLSSYGNFTVTQQQRIFRNDGDFHYVGAVHNQPKSKGPFISTRITLDHYGYLFHDKELKERKFKRTGSILKAELEKDPDNLYYRFQLARSYSAHGDKQEALTEIRKAYNLMPKDYNLRGKYIYVYGTYALICMQANEPDEAVTVCREGLALEPEYIDLHYILAYSLSRTGRKDEALNEYLNYIDLVNQFDNLNISTNTSIELNFMSTSFVDNALYYIVNMYYDQRRFDEAYRFSGQINDKSRKTGIAVKVLLKMERFEDLKEIIAEIGNDKDEAGKALAVIESEISDMNEEQREKVYEAFSKGADDYSLLNRFRLKFYENKYDEVDRFIRETDFDNLPEFYAELFINMDRNPRLIIASLKKMRRSKIKRYVKVMLDKRDELKDYLADCVLSENVRNSDYAGFKVFTGISYILLFTQARIFKHIIDESFEKYYAIFKKYVLYGISMMDLLYNGERLRLIYSTLDDEEDRFFIALKFAKEAVEKGDAKTGISYFREALHLNPYLACYMERYKDELFQGIVG